jgi:hypothetical protein
MPGVVDVAASASTKLVVVLRISMFGRAAPNLPVLTAASHCGGNHNPSVLQTKRPTSSVLRLSR